MHSRWERLISVSGDVVLIREKCAMAQNVRDEERMKQEEERVRETKGQACIKWMGVSALLGCHSAGICFRAYPEGSYRFTNGHRDN